MAIGHLTPAALKALREHGHPDYWEVVIYRDRSRDDSLVDSVTVECTQCGEVLVELVNEEQEEKETDTIERAKLYERITKRFAPEDLDEHVHELKSSEAADINNGGTETQFDYLYETCGADWLEELLGAEEPQTPGNKPDVPGCTCGEDREPHPCPYSEEINDNHEDECTCCPVCTERCAEEV
jgi:hypothetical protein